MSDPTLAKQRTGPKIARLSIINLRLSIAYQPDLDPILESVKTLFRKHGCLCETHFVSLVSEATYPSSAEVSIGFDTSEGFRAGGAYWSIESELIDLLQNMMDSVGRDLDYSISKVHKHRE